MVIKFVMEKFPLCPVCYELIEQPVTLPCSHELCLKCFQDSVSTANFNCPLCRRRISTWARRQTNTPINEMRRKELDEVYGQFGSPDDLKLAVSLQQEEYQRCVYSDSSGAIGLEYEEIKSELLAEKTRLEKLGEEEAVRLEREEKNAHKELSHQLESDEVLARSLTEQLKKEFEDSQVNVSLQIESDRKFAEDLNRFLNSSVKDDNTAVASIKTVSVKKPTSTTSRNKKTPKKKENECSVNLKRWFTTIPKHQ